MNPNPSEPDGMLRRMAPDTADSVKSAASTVAVVGLGKIGLPVAVQFARNGMNVIGCDVLPDVVDGINKGRSHIREEAGLAEGVAAAVADGKLHATLDTAKAVAMADVVVVIVPLMVSGDWKIDFRSLDSATEEVARGLRRGALVVYETTLPVGTTRRRLGPTLEKVSGLRAGIDFHLAFSPERLYAGRIFEDLRRYPKIVGGIDTASTQRAAAFYRSVLDAEVLLVPNAETAEFAKLAETTYRDVNIALANQLALFGAARNVDVATAFMAANSQPFSHLHRPSIGVGGHCIPVYPHFLLTDATEGELSLVSAGRQANDSMPAVCVDRLSEAMGGLGGRRVLVLGVSYREDVKELAFSTAIPLVDLLHRAGAQVLVHDPLFKPEELDRFDAEVVDLSAQAVADVEAVIVQALHRDLKDLDWRRFKQLRVVFDGRGSVDAEGVRAAGALYLAVGVDGSSATPRGPK